MRTTASSLLGVALVLWAAHLKDVLRGSVETDLLVRHADEALYEAKAAGRSTYRVSAAADT